MVTAQPSRNQNRRAVAFGAEERGPYRASGAKRRLFREVFTA